MLYFTKIIFNLFVYLCLGLQAKGFVSQNGAKIHLNEFSEFNVTQHDSIDDNSEAHSHKHKHSKEGQDHDHDHDHSKIVQVEFKIINKNFLITFKKMVIDYTPNFYDQSYLSNPHPLEIFRPPIV